MTTFRRYLLFQIPGWTLAVVVLFGFRDWLGLPLWAAALLFSLYVVKDFILYPFLRLAYEPQGKSGAELLVGQRGVVKKRIDPEGYVLVRGELWRARLPPGAPPAEPGAAIRIREARGMILTVESDET